MLRHNKNVNWLLKPYLKVDTTQIFTTYDFLRVQVYFNRKIPIIIYSKIYSQNSKFSWTECEWMKIEIHVGLKGKEKYSCT